ncbi:CcdC protein domain-containing protein [Kitasatospora mediocidica]|uniref:CcdC protein domain-containing protein n=1 Tax=Kitasatospora mediocidica TaxID=58352 RepID=UPI00056A328F|nr:CcdC protein domain-containing protein [Kitasatospora mediocidica]
MSGLVNIVVIVAVVALVVGRQLRAQKFDTERRFWVLPVVLGVLALRDPHLIDPHHKVDAVALLVASVVLVLAMGVVWGWTVRLWREADGSLWVKGSAATLAAWVGMIALRFGLYGIGSALHVHQSTNALLLTFGVLLLVRGAVVNWRARSVHSAAGLHVAS